MQHTYDIDDKEWEWPDEKPPVKDVHVYFDPSFMTCRHDYSCPVCRENYAVLNLNKGIMGPCWSCQEEGWELDKVDKRTWLQKLLGTKQ